MSVLVKTPIKNALTDYDRTDLIRQLKEKLSGRASSAYLFGSFASNTHTEKSDIDLLIIKDTDISFTKRAIEFVDLFSVFSEIDILVYTPSEFDRKINSADGFSKSLKSTLVKIL